MAKQTLAKGTAKLKPIKITVKENPAFKKQMQVVLREAKKLNKIDWFIIVT